MEIARFLRFGCLDDFVPATVETLNILSSVADMAFTKFANEPQKLHVDTW